MADHEYRPVGVDAVRWREVKAFVNAALAETTGSRRPNRARHRLLVSKVTLWSFDRGAPLDRDVIFDPANVEAFCDSLRGTYAPGTVGTYRSDLRSIGPRLALNAPWESRPVAVPTTLGPLPYTDEQLDVIEREVPRQRTEARRRAACAVRLLGLSTGLDGRWAARIRGVDVSVIGSVAVIYVPNPNARIVAVLEPFQHAVLAASVAAGAELLVGKGGPYSANWVSRLCARVELAVPNLEFSPSRFRATWLVDHLRRGTRIPELLAAAALSDTKSIGALAQHVPALPLDEALRAVRGT